MSELTIVSETPLTLAEVREKIIAIEKSGKELSFRANKTKDYIANFVTKEKNVKELKKKLTELNIPRLKDRHIVKIIDIYPQDPDSVKAILSGEAITLKDDDIQKILELLHS